MDIPSCFELDIVAMITLSYDGVNSTYSRHASSHALHVPAVRGNLQEGGCTGRGRADRAEGAQERRIVHGGRWGKVGEKVKRRGEGEVEGRGGEELRGGGREGGSQHEGMAKSSATPAIQPRFPISVPG